MINLAKGCSNWNGMLETMGLWITKTKTPTPAGVLVNHNKIGSSDMKLSDNSIILRLIANFCE